MHKNNSGARLEGKKIVAQLLLFEKKKTIYWNKYDPFVDLRMQWRASMMRHLFNILPGQRILEIGAGDGRFTQALVSVTRDECRITALVFSPEYQNEIKGKVKSRNLDVIYAESLPADLNREKFDYVVANHLLGIDCPAAFLSEVKSLIKPGGGLLLFEPNPWAPYPKEYLSLDRLKFFSVLSDIGYTQINALPYDFLYASLPRFLLWPMKHLSIILENFPYLRNFASELYIWARNPPPEGYKVPALDLCKHDTLFNKLSFVIPCHNEEVNILPLIERLDAFYSKYIFEVIIIDDASTDNTADLVQKLSHTFKYLRLIRWSPPSGVGYALRCGLEAAKGEYILVMDADFYHIIPELRDLFDAVVKGTDVVIGSRFSRESVLVNYAFTKIVANRSFHILANFLLAKRFRDISNNLKILRKYVAKRLVIESDDFAANAETGLKPILMGYKVVEVPISWINRSINMGFSTFRILSTGPNYAKILLKLFWRKLSGRPCQKEKSEL